MTAVRITTVSQQIIERVGEEGVLIAAAEIQRSRCSSQRGADGRYSGFQVGSEGAVAACHYAVIHISNELARLAPKFEYGGLDPLFILKDTKRRLGISGMNLDFGPGGYMGSRYDTSNIVLNLGRL